MTEKEAQAPGWLLLFLFYFFQGEPGAGGGGEVRGDGGHLVYASTNVHDSRVCVSVWEHAWKCVNVCVCERL